MTNAVALLAGLLPLYVVRFSIFGIPTNVFEVGVWVTAVTSICIPRTRHQIWGAMQAMPKSKLILIGLFLIAAVISTAISPVPRNSIGILKGWVITPMLFGFVVYVAVRAGKKAEIIRSLITSGLVVALFGLSQMSGFTRISSVYDVPNSLALFLVPICIVSLWIGMKTSNKLYQYSAVIILIAIILTQSFGAIIALVGTTIIGWFFVPSPVLGEGGGEGRSLQYRPLIRAQHPANWRGLWANLLPKREKGARMTLFAFLLITALIIFTISGRFQYLIFPLIHPGATNSVTVRLQLWDIGTSLIKKHLILGIGLGQFEPAYQAELHQRFAQQKNVIPEFVFRDPHNWIISFWLNMGLLGLASFIGLNYLAIRRSFSLPHDIYKQAIALALISMLIFGLFDTIYWKNDLSALWWMLIYLLM